MSKSLKDKANYYYHHLEQDNPYIMKRSKYKINKEEIPNELKKIVDIFELKRVALRHGCNRNFHAKMKVSDRRQERAKNKVNTRKEILE